MKRVACLVSAAALVVAGCASGSGAGAASGSAEGAPSAGGVTVGLTYIPNVQFAPFYLASERGQLGSDVTLRHHGQNEGLFTSLLAGREDVVVAGADEAAAAKQAGDLLVLAPYYSVYPAALLVPEDSVIKSWADLAGKRVGVPGRFGESWYALQSGLKSVGLSDSSVDIVEVGYTQQTALSTGKVDAVVGFTNNDAVQFALSGYPVRVIPLEGASGLVGASLVTTKSFAAKHPEQLRRVVDGAFKAFAAIKANPTVGVNASERFVPQLKEPAMRKAAAATMDATAKLLPSSCGFEQDAGERLVRALVEGGTQVPQFDASGLFSSEFCPK